MSAPYAADPAQDRKRGMLDMLRETKLPLWVSLLLALLLLIVFVWSRVSIGAAEARLANERQEMTRRFEADRAALLARLLDFTVRQDDESQRRFGTALAWAVRGELIRNNLDQVDQFFNQMVRMERVERVVLASQDGKILLSSDRHYQGGDLAALYPAELLGVPQVSVVAGAEGKKRVVIPVMGLTARLGTVVMDYAPATAPVSSQ
ncbi:MAG: hypothetical protein ACUVT2_01305 [Thiobacillaceae bacterium]